MRRPTQKSLNIPPFLVMDVLERAQQLERAGRSVIHMEVGEPDFPTPECVREAAMQAIQDGETKYTHSQGMIELREAIGERYYARYGVEVNPDRIIVTMGTSPALFLIFAALLEDGEEIVMTDPHYACYPNFVSFLGGQPVYSRVHSGNGFMPDVEDLKRRVGKETAGILINSPANPTGAVFDREIIERISGFGVPVISDEIYHGMTYGVKEHTTLEFTADSFVLNGFSKLYAMTGWRLGYVIVPDRFVRPMQKIHQNFFISAAAFVQRAGIAALRSAEPIVREMVQTYDKRRRYLLEGLREIGFSVPVDPLGAFFILVDARHLAEDSHNLAFDILEKTGVALTPGVDFGPGAEGHLRFSYANSIENLQEGVRRLAAYIEKAAPAGI